MLFRRLSCRVPLESSNWRSNCRVLAWSAGWPGVRYKQPSAINARDAGARRLIFSRSGRPSRSNEKSFLKVEPSRAVAKSSSNPMRGRAAPFKYQASGAQVRAVHRTKKVLDLPEGTTLETPRQLMDFDNRVVVVEGQIVNSVPVARTEGMPVSAATAWRGIPKVHAGTGIRPFGSTESAASYPQFGGLPDGRRSDQAPPIRPGSGEIEPNPPAA